MSTTLEISPLEARDAPACARLLSACFGTDVRRVHTGLVRRGRDAVFVVREAEHVVGTGTLRLRTAGFGGELVPVAVIANVAVDPALRGQGLGRILVQALLAEVERRRVDITLLVPRAEAFWTRFGFVRGGGRHTAEIELDRLSGRAPRGCVRRLEHSDLVSCTRLARAMARARNAWVVFEAEDRARRMRAPRRAWVLERAGELAAACTISLPADESPRSLLVHELLATDVSAAACVWSHLAGLRADHRTARWRVAPHDPLAVALGRAATFRELGSWMIRFRGAPAGGGEDAHRIVARFAASPPSLSALP